MRRGLMVVGCSALAVVVGHVGVARATPVQTVEQLNAALLDTLKRAEELGYKGRYDRLAPVIRDRFDVAFMAEKSLGRHWSALGAADRARWVEVFRDFTTANYAGNFDKYDRQSFEVLGQESSGNDTALVRTRVVVPGSESVELTYRLRQVGADWKIVDVYLKGTVSEIALRRSDYSSVLERDGFEALVAMIRGKIADLAAGRGKREGV